MRIAFNAQLLSAPRFGIWTYVFNLLNGLHELDTANDYTVFSSSDKTDIFKSRFNVIRSSFDTSAPYTRILWEHLAMPFILNRNDIDIFHNPDHVLPILPVKAKKIITVHDLSFYKFPGTFPFMKRNYKRVLTPRSVRLADKIIAVSSSTKEDIVELFGIDRKKIEVVHIGVSEEFTKIEDADALERSRKKLGLPEKFVLYLGTIEKRKNLERLIDAFVLASRRGGFPHKLVIAGKKGWLYKGLLKKIDDNGLKDGVILASDIKQSDLPILYNLAELFIYPSIYEGFGLPVLEAMACGTPVITSNTSSLPEVAGDAAVLVDPYNIEEIAHNISKLLYDKELCKTMSGKGIERAKSFTWERCARNTVEVYKKASYMLK